MTKSRFIPLVAAIMETARDRSLGRHRNRPRSAALRGKMTSSMKLVVWAIVLLVGIGTSSANGDTFGSGDHQFTIDFVTIGNPNNPADRTGIPNPAGSVDHVFHLGKYEVSREMI